MMERYTTLEAQGSMIRARCKHTSREVLVWRVVPSQPEPFAEAVEQYLERPPPCSLEMLEWEREQDTFFLVYEFAVRIEEAVQQMQGSRVCETLMELIQLIKLKGQLTHPLFLSGSLSQLKVSWLQEDIECWRLQAPERRKNRLGPTSEQQRIWNAGILFFRILRPEALPREGEFDLAYRELLKIAQEEIKAHGAFSDLFCLIKNMLRPIPCERVSTQMVEHSLRMIQSKFYKRVGGGSLMLKSSGKYHTFISNRYSTKSLISSLLPLKSTMAAHSVSQFHTPLSHYPKVSPAPRRMGTGLLGYVASQLQSAQPLRPKRWASSNSVAIAAPKRDNYTDPTFMFQRLKHYEQDRFQREMRHLEKLKLSRTAEPAKVLDRQQLSRRVFDENEASKPAQIQYKKQAAQQPLPLLYDSSSNRRSRRGCLNLINSNYEKMRLSPKKTERISERNRKSRHQEAVCGAQRRSLPRSPSVEASNPSEDLKSKVEQDKDKQVPSEAVKLREAQIGREPIDLTPTAQPLKLEQTVQKVFAVSDMGRSQPSEQKVEQLDFQQLRQCEIEPKELVKLYNTLGGTVKHANSKLKAEIDVWAVPCFLIYKCYLHLRKGFVASFRASLQPKLLTTLEKENASIALGLASMYSSLANSPHRVSEAHRHLVTPNPLPETFRLQVVPFLAQHFRQCAKTLKKSRLVFLRDSRLGQQVRYACMIGWSTVIVDHEEIFRGGPNLQTLVTTLLRRLENTPQPQIQVNDFLQEAQFRIQRILRRY